MFCSNAVCDSLDLAKIYKSSELFLLCEGNNEKSSGVVDIGCFVCLSISF